MGFTFHHFRFLKALQLIELHPSSQHSKCQSSFTFIHVLAGQCMPTDSMCAFLAKPLVKSGWWLEVHHHFQRKFILQTCEIPTVQATWHEKHAFLDSPLTYFQSLNSYDPTDMVIKGSQDGWGSFPLEELPAKPLLTWHWSGTWEAILLLLKQDKTVLSINPHQFSQLLYTMNSFFTQVHVLAARCIHEWHSGIQCVSAFLYKATKNGG